VLEDEVVGHLNPSVNRASSLHQHPATATRRILKFLRHTDVRFGSLADKAVLPALGITGLSLSLASGATTSTGGGAKNLPATSPPQELFLGEEEISDVSLSTFYVFDKENTARPQLGQKVAWGCGCRGCRCGGCRCGWRGYWGCGGCCWSWSPRFCRWC